MDSKLFGFINVVFIDLLEKATSDSVVRGGETTKNDFDSSIVCGKPVYIYRKQYF